MFSDETTGRFINNPLVRKFRQVTSRGSSGPMTARAARSGWTDVKLALAFGHAARLIGCAVTPCLLARLGLPFPTRVVCAATQIGKSKAEPGEKTPRKNASKRVRVPISPAKGRLSKSTDDASAQGRPYKLLAARGVLSRKTRFARLLDSKLDPVTKTSIHTHTGQRTPLPLASTVNSVLLHLQALSALLMNS